MRPMHVAHPFTAREVDVDAANDPLEGRQRSRRMIEQLLQPRHSFGVCRRLPALYIRAELVTVAMLVANALGGFDGDRMSCDREW